MNSTKAGGARLSEKSSTVKRSGVELLVPLPDFLWDSNKREVMVLCVGFGGGAGLAKDRQALHGSKSLFINPCCQCRNINVREIWAVGEGMPANRDRLIRQLDIDKGTTNEGFIFNRCKGSREDKVRHKRGGIKIEVECGGKKRIVAIRNTYDVPLNLVACVIYILQSTASMKRGATN